MHTKITLFLKEKKIQLIVPRVTIKHENIQETLLK